MRTAVFKNKLDPITKPDLDFLKDNLSKYDEIILNNEASNKDILNLVISNKNIKIIDNYNIGEEIFSPSYETLVKKGDFSILTKPVRDYIFKNCLYYDEIIKNYLSDYRYLHSMSVSEVCIKLARAHNYDVNKARIAGILHDVYKEIDKDTTLSIMNKYFKDLLHLPYAVYHSFTATIFLKEKLLIDDEEILNAIFNHTLGESNETLAKILFIADKIETLRGYDANKELAISLKNLDEGFRMVKKAHYSFLKRRDING